VRNAELHPGMGHYAEMEKYYRSLPEAEILASPSLMQGMSMLCALAMDYESSERWYGELQKFAERCGRQDAAGKQARSRLAWLDISLPQRGVNGLTETIPAVFRLLMNKENFIDYKSILIFAAAFGVTWKWHLHPILLIILAGIAGFLLY
jgi:LuxR family maltose regulon positive regulatory protein